VQRRSLLPSAVQRRSLLPSADMSLVSEITTIRRAMAIHRAAVLRRKKRGGGEGKKGEDTPMARLVRASFSNLRRRDEGYANCSWILHDAKLMTGRRRDAIPVSP